MDNAIKKCFLPSDENKLILTNISIILNCLENFLLFLKVEKDITVLYILVYSLK
jgi:hypothetical protein